MKKKSILVIFAIFAIAIIIALFIKGNSQKSKIEYNIKDVEVYKYIKYKNKENYGVIDRDGNIIIDASYTNIEIPNPAEDIFICYKDEEKSVVLNSKKETLFKEYEKIEPIKLKNIASTLCFEKSVLKYKKDNAYGLIDFDGNKLTQNEYSSIENLQSTEGKFLVSKNDKYGIINLNGALLVKTEYDQIITDEYYSEENKYVEAGFIVSNTTNEGYRYGYINYEGKKFLNTEYNEIIRVNNQKNVYLIAAKDGKYGLYKENKQVIKPEYQSIVYCDNGAILIEKNQQYGIANLKGEIKVDTKYSQIEENGIYLYAQNSKENDVYDSEGNKTDMSFSKNVFETTNENYRISTIINNGITYYGIENKQGKTLIDNNYNYIEYTFGDYFIVGNKDEKYGVINSNGRIILEVKYDLIQKIRNKNVIQILSRKNNDIKIYSSKLEEVVSMKSANVQNENTYIKISNKKEEIFLDKEGNKIEEKSDIVENDLKRRLPEKIGKYKKKQYSLDDVYYEKED